MKFTISAVLALAGVSQVLAIPTGNTTLLPRDNLTCGTTSNAVASHCDTLLNTILSIDPSAIYPKGRTCTYWKHKGLLILSKKAYNPICLNAPGNCCIYTENNNFSPEELRRYGKELMKCRSVEKNLINGRIKTPKGALCISDGNGCGDCFDD